MTAPSLIDAARAVARRHLNNSGMVELVEALEGLPPDPVIVSRALLLEAVRMLASKWHESTDEEAVACVARLREAAGDHSCR